MFRGGPEQGIGYENRHLDGNRRLWARAEMTPVPNRIETMLEGLRSRVFGSRLYDASLGTRPLRPAERPPILWPRPVMSRADDSDFQWLSWLSDEETPLDIASARTRALEWFAANEAWHPETWRADRIADRLSFSLTYFYPLCHEAPAGAVDQLAQALGRHSRHLFRLPVPGREQLDQLRFWRGRILAALYLPTFRSKLPAALGGLVETIPDLIHPDGGHFTRSPHHHLEALAEIIHIRALLAASRIEVPETLQEAIDRMAPMLRTFRHGDGELALFNSGAAGDRTVIESVLERSASRAKATTSAPHSGYHRLSARRSTVLFDAGAPVDCVPFVQGHAGTLSFEMSVGPNRLIVNCGSLPNTRNATLAEALRATAAHSTLTVADVHSSDLIAGGGFGERRAANVSARRREHERNVLVEASHDGYRELFGLMHRRSLYLQQDGLDLRGEDVLDAEQPTGRTFDIRFHLHPDVQVSLLEGGRSALMRLPTGRGWRLRTSDGDLALEESLYAGDGTAQNTSQIVIHGRHARRQTVVKWRLSREGG